MRICVLIVASLVRDAVCVAPTEQGLQFLNTTYDLATGYFVDSSSPGDDFWQTANGIEMLINYAAVSGVHAYDYMIDNSFALMPMWLHPHYTDDQLWWAFAWIRAYETMKDEQYLSKAVAIISHMDHLPANPFTQPAACNGILWTQDGPSSGWQTNTITNSLFFAAVTRLAVHRPTFVVGGKTMGEWADYMYKWFFVPGTVYMNNGTNPLWDPDTHIFADTPEPGFCSRLNPDGPGSRLFTYNQGVILTALVDYSALRNTSAPLLLAAQIVNASIAQFGVTNPGPNIRHVLNEPLGSPSDQSQVMFKGILVRKIGYVMKDLTAYLPVSWVTSFLRAQTASILFSSTSVPAPEQMLFGYDWLSAETTLYPVLAHISAMQAFVAAYNLP